MPVARVPAPHQPVARVLPLLGLPHLDRLFDYYVPAAFDEQVLIGCRVRIRFSGRLVDALVYARASSSEHSGKLSYIDRVISPAPVLTPAIARTVEMLADRYAGIRSDILRAAIPTRHAGAEKADFSTPWEDLGTPSEPDLSGWTSYRFGPSLVDAIIARVGEQPRPHVIDTWLEIAKRPETSPPRLSVVQGEAKDDGSATNSDTQTRSRPVLRLVQEEPVATDPADEESGKSAKKKKGKRRAPDSWKQKQHPPRVIPQPADSGETHAQTGAEDTHARIGAKDGESIFGDRVTPSTGTPVDEDDVLTEHPEANAHGVQSWADKRPSVSASVPDYSDEEHGDAPSTNAPSRDTSKDAGAHSEGGVGACANAGSNASTADRPAAVPRAAWQVLPGEKWEEPVAALATKVAIDGGGVLIVVPDARDVARIDAQLRTNISPRQFVTLEASLGHQARYRRFLSILSGQARIVVGTRSAAYAPVHNLSLIVCMFDGDDSLADPRAPYCHAREILTTRSMVEKVPLIIGGYSRTAETQLFVSSGWMHSLEAPRGVIEQRRPRIEAVGDQASAFDRNPVAVNARIPSLAFAAAREALGRELPVLVSVPRAGYIPTLACQDCRAPARCRYCNGPLRLKQGDNQAPPFCGWCGKPAANHRCLECGSPRLRAVVRGSDRTAEELGRAFRNVPVISSSSDHIIDDVDSGPRIVVATPGAEPRAEEGFGAALILDTWSVLSRADLRAHEEAIAQWAEVAARVRLDGRVVIMAEPSLAVVRSFLQWNMTGAAERELASRAEVAFPPTVHMAAIDGPMETISQFVEEAELPEQSEILGPVDLPVGIRMPAEYDTGEWGIPQRILIRSPLGPRSELGSALRRARALNSALANRTRMRVHVDPLHIG